MVDVSAPLAAGKAHAAVTEPVINAPVKPDVTTPVARVPEVNAAGKAPVSRGPEQAHRGRHDPGSRNPVVSFLLVRPISRRPEVSRPRAHGLLVHRQRGRSDTHRNA